MQMITSGHLSSATVVAAVVDSSKHPPLASYRIGKGCSFSGTIPLFDFVLVSLSRAVLDKEGAALLLQLCKVCDHTELPPELPLLNLLGTDRGGVDVGVVVATVVSPSGDTGVSVCFFLVSDFIC